MSTEWHVHNWRYGQTQAERLVTHLLELEGFKQVAIQAPLGGPDGRKDVLCIRDGIRYVGACYFPPTAQDYKEVRAKFVHDLKGVERNAARGFAFLTNQRLTLGQRRNLTKLHAEHSEIFDLERIVHLLDSPAGVGLRAQFLSIPMSAEDTVAFVTRFTSVHERRFDDIKASLLEISTRFRPETAVTTSIAPEQAGAGSVQVRWLLLLHRALCGERGPRASIGALRSARVWLGNEGSTEETATMVPIDPEQVPSRIAELLDRWEAQREALRSAAQDERLLAIARFHQEFLFIHPFLDGNGQVARFLLANHLLDLCRLVYEAKRMDYVGYAVALQIANETGDCTPLIGNILTGCTDVVP